MSRPQIGDIKFEYIYDTDTSVRCITHVVTAVHDKEPIWTLLSDQPERSKREEGCKGLCDNKGVTIPAGIHMNALSESTLRSMRCSEHCGNTVRDK